MNVLIDLTQIPRQKSGVGVYALNLVKQIAGIDFDNRYYLLVQDDDDSYDQLSRNKINILKVRGQLFRNLILRSFLEQCVIPVIIIKRKIDVVHSLHYSFPLVNFCAKRVVTIHDMSFFKFPEYHKLIKKLYFGFFIRCLPWMTDRIISISHSTMKDFISITGADPDKIAVIYLGKHDWSYCKFNDKMIDSIKLKHGIKDPYLLYIGTIEPRKNLAALVKAYHRLLNAGHNYKLVIAGKRGWGYKKLYRLIKQLGLKNDVIFTGFIPEKDKPYIIKGAKLFIYPSHYEGFGIPVLESLSLGVPTIAANVAALPEIAKDAAILVNPNNWQEIYHAVKHLSSRNQLRDEYGNKGLKQAEKFNWRNTALETVAVYREILTETF
jgi:glycosyltransferase involved in cell wall biosynthesis